MKINLIILAVICLLAGAWALYTQQKPPQFATEESAADSAQIIYLKAPNFSYQDINGNKGKLYDFNGKIVLLHFWATWCAPCLVEFPELMGLAESLKDDVVVLAVSTDHEETAIPRFLNRLGKNIPENFIIIPDVDKTITQDLYQTFKLPETYLLNQQSEIIEKLIGPQEDWNSEAWHTKIELLRSK